MTKDRLIGLVGYRSDDGLIFGAGCNYLEFCAHWGKPRILMPDEEPVKVDMLLLPGGPDITPASFGAKPTFKTGDPDVFRQYFFERRLAAYLEAGTPVFGICGGFQMLAVYFGSNMEQHLWRHPQSLVRSTAAHTVNPLASSPFGSEPFEVNSHHHQGILLKNISPELEPLVVTPVSEASEEPLVEAFAHKTLPVMAVQWHPEEWYDPFSCAMVERLLSR